VELINHTPFPALAFQALDQHGQRFHVVVLRSTSEIKADGKPLTGDFDFDFWKAKNEIKTSSIVEGSPRTGSTFSGFHDEATDRKAATVCTRGRWDSEIEDRKPFKIT
jgi:hypothetical protein